jgi:uncharacterized protein
MKFVLVVAALLFGFWVWRSGRRGEPPRAGPGAASGPAQPQDMVQCPVCSVHLPRGEAVTGRDGALYCSAEHRLRIEG